MSVSNSCAVVHVFCNVNQDGGQLQTTYSVSHFFSSLNHFVSMLQNLESMQNSHYDHRNFDNPAFIVFSCDVMENTIKQTVGENSVNNYELLEGAEQNIVICRAEGRGRNRSIIRICY